MSNEKRAPAGFGFIRDEILPNYMGVSKSSGTPKWMVYNGNPY